MTQEIHATVKLKLSAETEQFKILQTKQDYETEILAAINDVMPGINSSLIEYQDAEVLSIHEEGEIYQSEHQNQYTPEIKKLGDKGLKVKITDMNGGTNWMNLNNDSASAIVRFLTERYLISPQVKDQTVPEGSVNNGKCSKCGINDAQQEHSCPYQEDIHGDSDTLCNCCSDCENECCMDI